MEDAFLPIISRAYFSFIYIYILRISVFRCIFNAGETFDVRGGKIFFEHCGVLTLGVEKKKLFFVHLFLHFVLVSLMHA